MSTAKSLAALHLNGKRKAGTLTPSNRFKSSTSNLTAFSHNSNSKSRLQSTSMTNLLAGGSGSNNNNNSDSTSQTNRIHRPVSRNALDSIHNGMNAKYAQVQSKVYLQNIRPQQQQQQQQQHVANLVSSAASNQQKTKIPAKDYRRTIVGGRLTPATTTSPSSTTVPNERSAQLIKLKALQEMVDRLEEEKEQLKQELEREKGDKIEQVQLIKQELQEKLAEHDKQNEEYHQKLLEAYELADQNRRAADSVLSESRQREEDLRKKIEELEGQLNELKEFVTMKEEMTGKMYELREQIRDERQRYEEQLKSLHQVFENEKLSRPEENALTSVSNNSNKIHLDHNSNYFNRLKPSLQSTESINKQQFNKTINCNKCQSGSSQLHRSEHDIYGSKLSTRMHDTAMNAWRSSKQFAGSVITGKVGFSACRKCNRRQSSSLTSNGSKRNSSIEQQQQQQQVCRQVSSFGESGSAEAAELVSGQLNLISDDQQHTSVIEVQSLQPNSTGRLAPTCSVGGDQVQGEPFASSVETPDQQHQSSLIRRENNKLTIVTKFNDSECNINNNNINNNNTNNNNSNQSPNSDSLDLAAPSTGSERSRCESSSSGRGTSSSDAGSATASQNGDLDESHAGHNGPVPVCQDPALNDLGDKSAVTSAAVSGKRHKRKSSLFKASKVFGGSQVSLNKLKSFFTGSSGKIAVSSDPAHLDQQQQQQQLKDGRQATEKPRDHLESSRLRCLELSGQAAEVPIASSTTTTTTKNDQLGQGGPQEDGRAVGEEKQENLSDKVTFSLMRDVPKNDNVGQQQQVNSGGNVVLSVAS